MSITEELFKAFQPWGTLTNQVVGADIAVAGSAQTIVPTNFVHYITGTGEIATITIPYVGFCGMLALIPNAAFTLATGGNIAKAETATALEVMLLVYHPIKALWYPINV